MLFDIGLSNIFFDLSPQARRTKEKINKWDYIKLKSFRTVKETSNNTEKQPTKLEKVFINHISNRGLISRLYKELIQLNIKKSGLPWWRSG